MWVFLALAGFLLTNFDTFLVMLILHDKIKKKTHQIVVFCAFLLSLVLMMLVAWLGLSFLQMWIEVYLKPLFGFVFLSLAVIQYFKKEENQTINETIPLTSILKLFGFIVILNFVIGMDNILIYMGIFSLMNYAQLAYAISLQVTMLVVFYFLSLYLANLDQVQKLLRYHQNKIIALLFVFLSINLLFG
jgi:cadmium resistance protein CadD (predicted permease)